MEDLPAAELEAIAQIEVFAGHEVARVEETDTIERRPAKHQTGRAARVHLVDVRFGDVPHVVAAEARTPGKELAQADRLVEQRARDRERPPGIGVETAAGHRQAGPYGPCVGSGEEQVGKPTAALRVQDHVRAQKQDEPALASLETDVRGPSVAEVLG